MWRRRMSENANLHVLYFSIYQSKEKTKIHSIFKQFLIKCPQFNHRFKRKLLMWYKASVFFVFVVL